MRAPTTKARDGRHHRQPVILVDEVCEIGEIHVLETRPHERLGKAQDPHRHEPTDDRPPDRAPRDLEGRGGQAKDAADRDAEDRSDERIQAERHERDQLWCDPDEDVPDLRRQRARHQQPGALDQARHETGHQPGGQPGEYPTLSSGREIADANRGQRQHDAPQGQGHVVGEDDDGALGEREDDSDRRQVQRHDARDQAEPGVAPQEGDPVRHYLFSGWPRRPDGRKISTSTRTLNAITSFS